MESFKSLPFRVLACTNNVFNDKITLVLLAGSVSWQSPKHLHALEFLHYYPEFATEQHVESNPTLQLRTHAGAAACRARGGLTAARLCWIEPHQAACQGSPWQNVGIAGARMAGARQVGQPSPTHAPAGAGRRVPQGPRREMWRPSRVAQATGRPSQHGGMWIAF